MTALPSYQEAVARPDWLRLVSAHVSTTDYRSLCLVNRRFWHVFAPRLWTDLLGSARLSGLDPEDDLHWWLRFVFEKLPRVSPATRALVRVLDARGLARGACHFTPDQSDRTLARSLQRALELLPNVASLLVDGHADINTLGFLADTGCRNLRLLSVSDCSVQLPANFFRSPALQDLVFLDVSGLPGVIAPLLHPSVLPALRILKARNREIDNRTLASLARALERRLWSLDVSGNRITDAAVPLLTDCFPTPDLRSPTHFPCEGQLVSLAQGPRVFIQESPWSASFSHPERYLVDPPHYHFESEGIHQRSDCRSPPRHDQVDDLVQLLSQSHGSADAAVSRGLTHLTLSNNQVSALGIDTLLRASNGHIEYFACDSMPLLPADARWPRPARLHGILGEHLFRPVISSNLRVLRIHHSLVTSVPTLEMDGPSSHARALLAETVILPRLLEAFPLALIPDTNPRLASLTLTRIPRRSAGPLLERLVSFLQLLSAQECAVQDARELRGGRAPEVLAGIRHLRLEFEPEEGDLDVAELMRGPGEFSFFDDDSKNSSHHQNDQMLSIKQDEDIDGPEYITHHADRNGGITIPVWAGCNDAPATIREYRALVLRHGVHDGLGPVTPSQVAAGAPERCYIFHTAWCLAVIPPEPKLGIPLPSRDEVAAMRDVVDGLREYRARGRERYAEMERRWGEGRVPPGGPHSFWSGRLEVLS